MDDRTPEALRAEALGAYLRSVREGKMKMTLRQVEEATDKEVSNAYLSQLENGKITKPSPHMLHSLARAYGVPYEKLMERAGYIGPKTTGEKGKARGRVAAYSVDNLTADEEMELLKYLSWYRSGRGRSR